MMQTVMLPELAREKGKAMTSHERASDGTEEWLTPPAIIQALGAFDLDPCAPVVRPWPTAAQHYTIHDNGLMKEWTGRVWLNPPYGDQTVRWLRRLKAHGNGIALVPPRSETRWFFECVWNDADAILFKRGRIQFYLVNGKLPENGNGAPSCFIAYGAANVDALAASGIDGKLIRLK
jgi:hypothetical protein